MIIFCGGSRFYVSAHLCMVCFCAVSPHTFSSTPEAQKLESNYKTILRFQESFFSSFFSFLVCYLWQARKVFLFLLATPPSVTLAQQRVSTILLKITFPVGIQKAVSKLFSLSCLMNHNFVSSSLQEVLEGDFFGLWTTSEMWVAVFLRQEHSVELKTFNRERDVLYWMGYRRAVLEFSYHIPYSFSLRADLLP